ncbi:MAG TPA: 50S ribosomal protein L21 [Candidatus Eisenbacteria bacterium]|nr:50S ribosomal protein L21 [Candidatus Eisenbacteria bacterium]
MKYAVITSGGKQYRVSEGDTVVVEKLGLSADDSYTFPEVLLFVDGDKKEVGTPAVKGVVVSGKVVGEKKTRKVRVAKFKAKAKYRRVTGHRSVMTHVRIETISAGKSSAK